MPSTAARFYNGVLGCLCLDTLEEFLCGVRCDMGYYANAALERSYRERSCCGYPSREETLTYYLEDLQAMLSPRCDAARYAGVKGRYRHYEVLWAAAPGERDICAAIAEVERELDKFL